MPRFPNPIIKADPPKDLCCRVNMYDIMYDPCFQSSENPKVDSGMDYEADTLKQLISKKSHGATGLPIDITLPIIPHPYMKKRIRRYLEEHPESWEDVYLPEAYKTEFQRETIDIFGLPWHKLEKYIVTHPRLLIEPLNEKNDNIFNVLYQQGIDNPLLLELIAYCFRNKLHPLLYKAVDRLPSLHFLRHPAFGPGKKLFLALEDKVKLRKFLVLNQEDQEKLLDSLLDDIPAAYRCTFTGLIMYEPSINPLDWSTHEKEILYVKSIPDRSAYEDIRTYLEKNPAHWAKVYLPKELQEAMQTLMSSDNPPEWKDLKKLLDRHPGIILTPFNIKGENLFAFLFSLNNLTYHPLLIQLTNYCKEKNYIKTLCSSFVDTTELGHFAGKETLAEQQAYLKNLLASGSEDIDSLISDPKNGVVPETLLSLDSAPVYEEQDFFLDALAQGLNARTATDEVTVKSLRLLIQDALLNPDTPFPSLRALRKKTQAEYLTYCYEMAYTDREKKEGHGVTGTPANSRDPLVHANIICHAFNIQLLLSNYQEEEVSYTLIDQHDSKIVQASELSQLGPNVLHLLQQQGHFVPAEVPTLNQALQVPSSAPLSSIDYERMYGRHIPDPKAPDAEIIIASPLEVSLIGNNVDITNASTSTPVVPEPKHKAPNGKKKPGKNERNRQKQLRQNMTRSDPADSSELAAPLEPAAPTAAPSEPVDPPAAPSEPIAPPAALSEPVAPPAALSEPIDPTAALSEPVAPPAAPPEPVDPPAAPPEPVDPPAAPSEPVDPPAAPPEPVDPPAAPSEPVDPPAAPSKPVPIFNNPMRNFILAWDQKDNTNTNFSPIKIKPDFPDHPTRVTIQNASLKALIIMPEIVNGIKVTPTPGLFTGIGTIEEIGEENKPKNTIDYSRLAVSFEKTGCNMMAGYKLWKQFTDRFHFHMIPITKQNAQVGMTVVRGPFWSKGPEDGDNEDGGNKEIGCILEIKGNKARVGWHGVSDKAYWYSLEEGKEELFFYADFVPTSPLSHELQMVPAPVGPFNCNCCGMQKGKVKAWVCAVSEPPVSYCRPCIIRVEVLLHILFPCHSPQELTEKERNVLWKPGSLNGYKIYLENVTQLSLVVRHCKRIEEALREGHVVYPCGSPSELRRALEILRPYVDALLLNPVDLMIQVFQRIIKGFPGKPGLDSRPVVSDLLTFLNIPSASTEDLRAFIMSQIRKNPTPEGLTSLLNKKAQDIGQKFNTNVYPFDIYNELKKDAVNTKTLFRELQQSLLVDSSLISSDLTLFKNSLEIPIASIEPIKEQEPDLTAFDGACLIL